MNFKLLQEMQNQIDGETKILREYIVESWLDGNGVPIKESIVSFVKDADEMLRHGTFPMWTKTNPKVDEQPDGDIDNRDKILYFAKVIAGLVYYISRNVKSDKAAFDEIENIKANSDIVDNVKAQAEKNTKLKAFVQKVADTFNTPATKAKLANYVKQINDYYVKS